MGESDPEIESLLEARTRSRRYRSLSDDALIELALRRLPDRDRYYLNQELELRGLAERARVARREATRREMRARPWWKYIPMLFALAFLAKQLLSYL
ncbi:MAG: hypothetical protein KatS3mg124_1884 [Porticoccaceae bacterium]|nr:MAG: hypothetical protein KatS3mg124_1884 [Porticoccaceae bacterium]